jgi:hypothetical protein
VGRGRRAHTVPITVTAPLDAGNFSTTFVCTDADGNQTSNRVPDGQSFSQVDGSGQTFRFNVQAFLDSLEFDQDTFPPSAVARCDVTLHRWRPTPARRPATSTRPRSCRRSQTRSVQFLLR